MRVSPPAERLNARQICRGCTRKFVIMAAPTAISQAKLSPNSTKLRCLIQASNIVRFGSSICSVISPTSAKPRHQGARLLASCFIA